MRMVRIRDAEEFVMEYMLYRAENPCRKRGKKKSEQSNFDGETDQGSAGNVDTGAEPDVHSEVYIGC